MGMLCNVVNSCNIDNDMIQFINSMNNPYIFSLLPCILVYKVHDFELCHGHVSAQPDVYPSHKLSSH